MNIYLIAKKLSHSFSPLIHSHLATYSYGLKEIEEAELEEFFKNREFDGLNVTIPYKSTVMKYLDEISGDAERIGAVNTVVKRNGKLYGFNTDYYGFSYMVKQSGCQIKDADVVIIGSGGASKTVQAVCYDMGASSVRVLTHSENKEGSVEKYYNANVIVNTSPVGMFPENGKAPVTLSNFKNCKYVLDLIYNPMKTKLVLDAEKLGIKAVGGISMLVAQAKKACEIFLDSDISDEKIKEIQNIILAETVNIVLVGMPGCGKTTVGKELSKLLNREFYDCDEEIEKSGASPAEIIKSYGEQAFREKESEMLCELCKKSGSVIATGGGAVTVNKNFDIIRQNAFVVFLNRDISLLETKGRPLSAGGEDKLKEMQKTRLPFYKQFSDATVESLEEPPFTAKAIEKEFRKGIECL